METSDWITLAGVAAILAFLRSLRWDMRGLSDRVARLEGLIEGLRDSITGRANRGTPR